jgi:hypothetical protein
MKLSIAGKMKLKLCSGNCFGFEVIVPLTFDLVTPKPIGVFWLI